MLKSKEQNYCWTIVIDVFLSKFKPVLLSQVGCVSFQRPVTPQNSVEELESRSVYPSSHINSQVDW